MFSVADGHRLTEEEKTSLRLHSRFFPNQINAGLFSPHSTIIEVAVFHSAAVGDAVERGDLLSVRRDIQVLGHELTHWLDFFGTIWGRQYIKQICTAYLAYRQRDE